jgi:tetratricopeptide (TPR) repeat protein
LALVAAWSGQFEAGLHAAEQITALADEETDWEMQQRWRIDGLYVAMRVHIENKDQSAVRDLGEQAIALIDSIERRCSPMTPDQTRRLGNHTHNIACALRGIAQYDLAIPLFERTITYHADSAWTYLYLAAAVWATTADRDRTLTLLHQASLRHPAHNLWQEAQRENLLPEFDAVRTDPAFERATNGIAN